MYRQKQQDGTVRLTGQVNTTKPIDAWPVNSIFFGFTSTNPATLLGGGTWQRIAEGKMLVGQDPSDIDFDVLAEQGGSKTKTLGTNELPTHDHNSGSYTADNGGNHTHTVNRRNSTGSGGGAAFGGGTAAADMDTGSSGPHSHLVSGQSGSRGSGLPFSIMNPYLVVYIWRRTA